MPGAQANVSYPFDVWFDGKGHWLKRGTHFTCTTGRFMGSMKTAADLRNLGLEMQSREQRYVYLRVFPRVR